MDIQKWNVLLCCVLGIASIVPGCLEDDEEGNYEYDGNTPVYVTIYSHNEDSWGPIVTKKDAYRNYRAGLLDRLQIIHDYGAKLNWQSDWIVLKYMDIYESGALLHDTNGKNIVRYMVEDLNFSADPHGHLKEYNYADLAYMLERLNVTPSEVVGGVTLFEWGSEYEDIVDFTDWHSLLQLAPDGYIYGDVYPKAKWMPGILSCVAIGGHWFDETSSGIWRPGNEDDYFIDQETGYIKVVGQGYPHDRTMLGTKHTSGAGIFAENGAYIKELVEKIKSGEVPSGKMYTASIHVRDTWAIKEGNVEVNQSEGLRTILEELRPYAEHGEIVYVTYQEAVDVWMSEQASEPYRLDMTDFSMYEDMKEDAMAERGR